jgi:hypothetical protein
MAIEQLPVRRTTNPSSRHTSCVRTCLCDSREPRSHGPAGRRALLLALLDALLAGGRRRRCQPAKAPPLQRRALLAPAREPNLSPLALQGDVLARAFRRLPPADLACAELVCRRFRSEGEAQRGRPWSPGWLPAPWRGEERALERGRPPLWRYLVPCPPLPAPQWPAARSGGRWPSGRCRSSRSWAPSRTWQQRRRSARLARAASTAAVRQAGRPPCTRGEPPALGLSCLLRLRPASLPACLDHLASPGRPGRPLLHFRCPPPLFPGAGSATWQRRRLLSSRLWLRRWPPARQTTRRKALQMCLPRLPGATSASSTGACRRPPQAQRTPPARAPPPAGTCGVPRGVQGGPDRRMRNEIT